LTFHAVEILTTADAEQKVGLDKTTIQILLFAHLFLKKARKTEKLVELWQSGELSEVGHTGKSEATPSFELIVV